MTLANRRQIGQALRLAGPLLQVVSLAGLFGWATADGPSGLRPILYALFFAGFILTVIGNVLVRLRGGPSPKAGAAGSLRAPEDAFDR